MIINPFYLSKAVDTMEWDAPVAARTRPGDELSRLRADVDQLLARAAR